MAIERKNLRSQVRDELLTRMRAGDVQPGEGINEVQLAAELGVSRTPLREALIALESEGQIESQNGKGFRFVSLSKSEFEELAPILATLEALALRLSPAEQLTDGEERGAGDRVVVAHLPEDLDGLAPLELREELLVDPASSTLQAGGAELDERTGRLELADLAGHLAGGRFDRGEVHGHRWGSFVRVRLDRLTVVAADG